MASSKCLSSNLVMLVVLGPDAKGKLTLKGIFIVFKRKLNHALVLGPDDERS